MNVESTDDSIELIKNLGDRIEDIERTLYEDEDFCNKDLDATYEAALKCVKNIEEKLNEKLIEFKIKLEQTREENIKISKQNKKQFDDEIEEINQLFSSGKHQEAVDKFQDYEKRFQQRTTNIQNIPKLYMNDIDINRYFSIDKPISIPPTPSSDEKRTSFDHIKPNIKAQYYSQKPNDVDLLKKDDDDSSEKEFQRLSSRRSENQQTLSNNKESKSPSSTTSSRVIRFSTRLPPSSSSTSLPTSERNITTPLSAPITHLNSRENNINHSQVRSTPASPYVIPSVIQRPMATVKNSKAEGLTKTYVAHYRPDQKISLLMACNKKYLVLFTSQSDRLVPIKLTSIERSNLIDQDLLWEGPMIISIGFVNKNNIYLFTERNFTIYSLDTFSVLNNWVLFNNIDQPRGEIGAVYNEYVYHIYANDEDHRVLSIFELDPIKNLCDYDLSINFPHVKRFIHICINDKLISFLVEMEGSQYGVIFCPNNLESHRLIHLSYANKPLTICSTYIPYLDKYIFFVNDPSAKIIHLLTNEKYLQSCTITAYTLSYIQENNELILASNDGIYSININEQESFFSKFYSN